MFSNSNSVRQYSSQITSAGITVGFGAVLWLVFMYAVVTFLNGTIHAPDVVPDILAVKIVAVSLIFGLVSSLIAGIGLLQRQENGWPHILCYSIGVLTIVFLMRLGVPIIRGIIVPFWVKVVAFLLVAAVVGIISSPVYYVAVRLTA